MHTFSPHTKAESAKVNENFTDLSTGEGDVNSNRLELFRAEVFRDFVDTGLVWSIVSGLNGTMTTGVAYITDPTPLMLRLEVASITSRTFTASKDTYCDLGFDGVVDYNEVANGATAPALASNHIRLAKVVTNGSAITSIVTTAYDSVAATANPIRNLAPVHVDMITNPYKFFVYRSTAWNWGNNAYAKVNFNAEVFDTNNDYDATTNFRYDVPVDGFYWFYAMFRGDTISGSGTNGELRKNGVGIVQGDASVPVGYTGGFSHGIQIMTLLYCQAGDYIEIFSYGGNNVGHVGQTETHFQGFLVSQS